jgi:hypothetical protein
LETLNFLAAEDAPLTRKSAPLIRIAKPTRRRRKGRNIDAELLSFRKDITFSPFRNGLDKN